MSKQTDFQENSVSVTKVIMSDSGVVSFTANGGDALVQKVNLMWDRASQAHHIGFTLDHNGEPRTLKIPLQEVQAGSYSNEELLQIFGAKSLNERPLVSPAIVSAIANHMGIGAAGPALHQG